MSAPVQAPTQASANTQLLKPVNAGIIQRKCACGSTPGLTGLCTGCQEKRLVQRYPLDRAAPGSHLSLRSESSLQAVSSAAAGFAPAASHSFGRVQVHPPAQSQPADSSADEPSERPQSEADKDTVGPTEVSAPEAQAGPVGLIVDDQAREPAPDQMRKTAFLDEMERAVCAAADAELAAVGRTAQGCPYISTWIGYYRNRESSHIERALRRYAPEAAGARNAREYIPFVAERVRRAASVWATTGEITGVPEEIVSSLSGPGLPTADAMVSAAGSTLSAPAENAGGIFTKAKDGGARRPDDPEQMQSELQNGRPLDTAVRSRMESAFAHDFSRVRVHTDSGAAAASSRINARAFTIGSDVAFGAGEYAPGTIVGDALLAHELAHVVQQQNASTSSPPMAKSEGDYNKFEEDADRSAVTAVMSLWSGQSALSTNQKGNPQLRSGLSLRRCKSETCSEGVKNISVDLVKLEGSSRTPATDLAEANKIYKKCCVQFNASFDQPAPKDKSDAWLGGDTDMNASGITCSKVTAEEKAMYDGAASEFSLSGRMRAFYVQTFSGYAARAFSRPPYCANGTASPYANHLIIKNTAQDDTLAHEFGHILLNNKDHTGIDDKTTKANLMVSPGRTSSDIDDSQCKIIYNNA